MVIGMVSCNMKPVPEKVASEDTGSVPDSLLNGNKPVVIRDTNGNIIKRRDVTLNPYSKVKTRNEYHFAYDSLNNRIAEQIWYRTPDGLLLSHTEKSFMYEDGLLVETTLISYDSTGREDNRRVNRYKYDNNRRETEVAELNSEGNLVSATLRIYNDNGFLWKEVLIDYDDNGHEMSRSGLEFNEKGAIVGKF